MRCEDCATKKSRRQSRDLRRRQRRESREAAGPRRCITCRVDISRRGHRSERCEEHAAEWARHLTTVAKQRQQDRRAPPSPPTRRPTDVQYPAESRVPPGLRGNAYLRDLADHGIALRLTDYVLPDFREDGDVLAEVVRRTPSLWLGPEERRAILRGYHGRRG